MNENKTKKQIYYELIDELDYACHAYNYYEYGIPRDEGERKKHMEIIDTWLKKYFLA